jgi:mRNA interferase MazF
VWWVSFDPSLGSEIRQTRPAIILSNNMANAALNRVVVVPVSSQTQKVYPSEALVTLNGESRKAMTDQVATAAKQRLRSRLGAISAAEMKAVEDALLLHLAIRRAPAVPPDCRK